MKLSTVSLLTVSALLAGSLAAASAADAAKPKYNIEQVMKALHKGQTNVGKKVAAGQGTKEDFAKLVDYYESLPLCKPEKGDQKSWDEKTKALLDAAKGLQAGTPDALAAYKKAVNCKACHNVHKPD